MQSSDGAKSIEQRLWEELSLNQELNESFWSWDGLYPEKGKSWFPGMKSVLAVEEEVWVKPLAWQTCWSTGGQLLPSCVLAVDAEGLLKSDWFILWTSYGSLESFTVIKSQGLRILLSV